MVGFQAHGHILCGERSYKTHVHVYMYMYDVTVHCMAIHYTTATAMHYCVKEEERGGLKEGR